MSYERMKFYFMKLETGLIELKYLYNRAHGSRCINNGSS